MFVKYSPKVPHVKIIPLLSANEGNAFDNDSVILRPGTNELTDKEWDAIQPHIKDQLGKEIVAFSVPVKNGKKETRAKTLKDVPVATARKIIQGCQDPNTLRKWFNQELPDELVLVLSKRMRKLKIEPKDLGDEDEGLDIGDDDITPEGSKDDGESGDDDLDNGDNNDGESGDGGKELGNMTVAELKAYASERGISVSGNKDEIIAAIIEAEED